MMAKKLSVRRFDMTCDDLLKYSERILKILAESAHGELNNICENFDGVRVGENDYRTPDTRIMRSNYFVSGDDGGVWVRNFVLVGQGRKVYVTKVIYGAEQKEPLDIVSKFREFYCCKPKEENHEDTFMIV